MGQNHCSAGNSGGDMTLVDRLHTIADALPSDDASVTFRRSDLLRMLDGETEAVTRMSRDLTVHEVAEETQRAASTVRGWLIDGELEGYKIMGRDWRVTREALRRFLTGETTDAPDDDEDDVDIRAWRKLREAGS